MSRPKKYDGLVRLWTWPVRQLCSGSGHTEVQIACLEPVIEAAVWARLQFVAAEHS